MKYADRMWAIFMRNNRPATGFVLVTLALASCSGGGGSTDSAPGGAGGSDAPGVAIDAATTTGTGGASGSLDVARASIDATTGGTGGTSGTPVDAGGTALDAPIVSGGSAGAVGSGGNGGLGGTGGTTSGAGGGALDAGTPVASGGGGGTGDDGGGGGGNCDGRVCEASTDGTCYCRKTCSGSSYEVSCVGTSCSCNINGTQTGTVNADCEDFAACGFPTGGDGGAGGGSGSGGAGNGGAGGGGAGGAGGGGGTAGDGGNCEGDTCWYGIDGTCSCGKTCSGSSYEVSCVGTSCSCNINGTQTGTVNADCEDFAACGFPTAGDGGAGGGSGSGGAGNGGAGHSGGGGAGGGGMGGGGVGGGIGTPCSVAPNGSCSGCSITCQPGQTCDTETSLEYCPPSGCYCEVPATCFCDGTYTLSGTVIKSGVADGTYAYLKLVDGPTTDYWTKSTAFSSGNATYSVSGVEEGSYTGWVFIDINGNGGSSLEPDSGDYYTSADVNVSSDKTLDIPESAWTLY